MVRCFGLYCIHTHKGYPQGVFNLYKMKKIKEYREMIKTMKNDQRDA